MKPIKVGLLGLGTVGTGVVRIVEGHQRGFAESGRIADRHREDSCSKYRARLAQYLRSIADKLTEDPWEIIRNPEIDVIVEVMGGIEHDEGIHSGGTGARQARRDGE